MNNKKYYIGQSHKLVEVSEEIKRAMDQGTNHHRYLARKLGECEANRRGAACCDGDCHTCWHWVPKMESVEQMDEWECTRLMDRRVDLATEMEIREWLIDLERVDPDGRVIGYMLARRYTVREIAEYLGINDGTLRYRLKQIGKKLKEE